MKYTDEFGLPVAPLAPSNILVEQISEENNSYEGSIKNVDEVFLQQK